jgi:hypothetical protein
MFLDLLVVSSAGAEPCFKHDCADCTFIGVARVHDIGGLNGERVDLYVCLKQDGNHDFIYRYGDDGQDYGAIGKDLIQNRRNAGITDYYTEIQDIWNKFHNEILGNKPTFKQFVLSGKAIFTVHNNKGEHYTYRVFKTDEKGTWGVKWFVSLLTGPNNMVDYQYIGTLDSMTGTVRSTRASVIAADSLPMKVINWALCRIVWQNKIDKLPEGYGIKHEGRCGRCGRVLTTPQSIEYGIGPECLGKMGF